MTDSLQVSFGKIDDRRVNRESEMSFGTLKTERGVGEVDPATKT